VRLEDELRQLFGRTEAAAWPGEREAFDRFLRRRSRRGRAVAAAAGLALVAVLAGAVLTRAVLVDRPTPVLGPLLVQDATPAQLAGGRWRALPVLPAGQLDQRERAAVVWTGRQLIYWGGASHPPVRAHADGAAFYPDTNRWATLPPAPEGQWQLEGDDGVAVAVDDGVAVWTGREVLVWGGMTIPDPVAAPNMATLADGVAYDPARRTWRRLPRPPVQLRWASLNQWVLWTGRELMVGGVEAGPGGGTRAGAYDPATNRWRLLPRSPKLTGGRGHLQARTAMWAGTRLLVWNFWSPTARTANNPSAVASRPEAEPDGIDLWAYDPAGDRWTVLPDPPDQVRRMVAGASMVWTGQEVIIASAQTAQRRTVTRAGRYDPDRARWTPIAPPPRSRGANPGRVTLEWTGSAVVELGNAVYDPAADRWLPLPAEPDQATPPLVAESPARALLRVQTHADGAVQVYVLEPDRPPATP
jgi:hypothetical protein